MRIWWIRQEVFCKNSVLRNYAKFTGKHLCQNLFFNNVTGLRPATSLKKRLWYRCFPVNFSKLVKTGFIQNTSGRLLLQVSNAPRAGFEPAQNLNLDFLEWTCAVEITTTLQHHDTKTWNINREITKQLFVVICIFLNNFTCTWNPLK